MLFECFIFRLCFIILLYLESQVNALSKRPRKDCMGHRFTNLALFNGQIIFESKSPQNSYHELKQFIGTNCTHVVENLVIYKIAPYYVNDTQLIMPDLSFLQSIEEVNGFVFIADTHVGLIPLHNLQLIRGKMFYRTEIIKEVSLFISETHDLNVLTAASLQQVVDLKSLREIQAGNVYISGNTSLCYMAKHIDWKVMFDNTEKQTLLFNKLKNCTVELKCHTSCEFCWGPNVEQCQIFSHLCKERDCLRCFQKPNVAMTSSNSFINTSLALSEVPMIEECCSEQCIGGCTGTSATECIKCRDYQLDDECVSTCPERFKYNNFKGELEPVPDARLIQGSNCVQQCFKGLYVDENSCVTKCATFTKGYHIYVRDMECVKCRAGHICPKDCDPKSMVKMSTRNLDAVDILFTPGPVLRALINCTSIVNVIRVNHFSHIDNPDYQTQDFTADDMLIDEDLWSLRNVENITASLGFIELNLEAFQNIYNATFLEKIKSISAQRLFLNSPTMQFLGWKNLRSIQIASIHIRGRNLCYLENLESYIRSINQESALSFLAEGMPLKNCTAAGKVCDVQCHPKLPCWGPGPEMCTACRTVSIAGRCVGSCSDIPGFYFDTSVEVNNGNNSVECKPCHEECANTCVGPGAHECVGGCKNFKNMTTCISKCQHAQYADRFNICQPCHEVCGSRRRSNYCTGPSDFLGKGGCSDCLSVLINNNVSSSAPRCIRGPCPEIGYYTGVFTNKQSYTDGKLGVVEQKIQYFMEHGYAMTAACKPCDQECRKCKDRSDLCQSCVNYALDAGGGNFWCLPNCYKSMAYLYNETLKLCKPCDRSCMIGCSGPSNTDCLACRAMKVYLNDKFACMDQCPPDFPYESRNTTTGELICSVHDDKAIQAAAMRLKIGAGIGVPLLIIFILGATVYGVLRMRKEKKVAEKENIQLHSKYIGGNDYNPSPLITTELDPLMSSSNYGRPKLSPNTCMLRIINENELQREDTEIGCGAFGTVYRALWFPSQQRYSGDDSPISSTNSPVTGIKVAVKILTDIADSSVNVELLNEARVMASVDNDYCMGLIGVCMTASLQLISPFMPHGSLLTYVRNKKEMIRAHHMMTWVFQIARGMTYLESRGIIHRDLAARNVLVQTPHHIRITDFGLAKVLDADTDVFKATGGKMPIKWLALECIQHRKFSHKSDVWAFGVTMWEIFTYGAKPYEDLHASKIAAFLESGERLHQPGISTLDLYMLVIQCWILDVEGRPTFAELAEHLSEMIKEPERFLIIHPSRATRQLSDDTNILDCSSRSLLMPNLSSFPHANEDYLRPSTSWSLCRDPCCPNDQSPTQDHHHHHDASEIPILPVKFGHLEALASSRKSPVCCKKKTCSYSTSDQLSSDNSMSCSPSSNHHKKQRSVSDEARYVEDPLSVSNTRNSALWSANVPGDHLATSSVECSIPEEEETEFGTISNDGVYCDDIFHPIIGHSTNLTRSDYNPHSNLYRLSEDNKNMSHDDDDEDTLLSTLIAPPLPTLSDIMTNNNYDNDLDIDHDNILQNHNSGDINETINNAINADLYVNDESDYLVPISTDDHKQVQPNDVNDYRSMNKDINHINACETDFLISDVSTINNSAHLII